MFLMCFGVYTSLLGWINKYIQTQNGQHCFCNMPWWPQQEHEIIVLPGCCHTTKWSHCSLVSYSPKYRTFSRFLWQAAEYQPSRLSELHFLTPLDCVLGPPPSESAASLWKCTFQSTLPPKSSVSDFWGVVRDCGILMRPPDYGEQQSMCSVSLKSSWEVSSFVMMDESNWSNNKQKK